MKKSLDILSEFSVNEAVKQKVIYLIHRAYLNQRINGNQLTHSTKTRSEVKGGGRKPWKQKGTGRARAGSKSSPLWRGGGVVFGPKPLVKNHKINKKEKKKALLYLLKAKQKSIKLVPDITFFNNVTKTKDLLSTISTLGVSNRKKIGILIFQPKLHLYLASRNIKNIKVLNIQSLNISNILTLEYLISDNSSLDYINTFYKI